MFKLLNYLKTLQVKPSNVDVLNNGKMHTISSFIVLICNDLKCFLLKTFLRTRCSFFSLQHSFPLYVTSSTSYKRFMNCLYDVNSNNIALTMHLTFLQFFTRCSAIQFLVVLRLLFFVVVYFSLILYTFRSPCLLPFSFFFFQHLYIDGTNNSIYYLVLQERRKKNPRKYYFIQFICSDYFILCIGHEVEPIYWSSFLYLFELVCCFFFGHVWTLCLWLQSCTEYKVLCV